jgi:hypothetical protein
MNNSIYLTFDWDKVSNEQQWMLDFSIIKKSILEQIYLPQGWDVVIGKSNDQITLTLLDKRVIYYTLYGSFDSNGNKVVISKIDYIYLPNDFSYNTIKVSFIASPSKELMDRLPMLDNHQQPPLTYQFILKQHSSLMKNKFQRQLNPLQMNQIKKIPKSNRFTIDVSAIPYEVITNSYDKYILFRLEQGQVISVSDFIEHAHEVGVLESWNSKKNQLVFTYNNHELIPSKKDLKGRQYYLVNQSLYSNVKKTISSQQPLLMKSLKGRADYRFVVKHSLHDLLLASNLKPSWRNHYQYIYYTNDSIKSHLVKQVLDRLIESKHPITAIVQPETKAFLTSRGMMSNALDVEKLKQKIQKNEVIANQYKEEQAAIKTLDDKLAVLKSVVNDLESEIKLLERAKLVNYKAVSIEKEELLRLLQQKEFVETQLVEANETEILLQKAYKELQHQLDANLLKEKSYRKFLEEVYVQLSEFRKDESIYIEVFENKLKASTTRSSIQQLDKNLDKSNKLLQNIEKSTETILKFFHISVEEQLGKFNSITQVEKLFKDSKDLDDIKGIYQQYDEQLSSIQDETNYVKQLDTQYNSILERFSVINIRLTQIPTQHYAFSKTDLEYIFRNLIDLLNNQPNRILTIIFRNRQKEWQQKVTDYFKKFIAGYKYWQKKEIQANVQKEKIRKQMQLIIFQYSIQMKNMLYEKKHETEKIIRNTEIEIANVYAELFKLNRECSEIKSNLKYYDDSLDEKKFIDRKSSLELEKKELTTAIQNLSSEKQLILDDLDNYKEKIKVLKKEVSIQSEQFIQFEKQSQQVEKRYKKLFTQYKNDQTQTSNKINELETKQIQLEHLELEKIQLVHNQHKNSHFIYLPILSKVYERHHDIQQSQNWLTVNTSDKIGEISGITIIENIQSLTPLSMNQIAQQADYIIAFCPIDYHYLLAPTMERIQISHKPHVLVDKVDLYDECVAKILNQTYSNKFKVTRKKHNISTSHIRNDQYITWITVNSQITSSFEMLFKELQTSQKILIDEQITDSKVKVKLFSDDIKVMEELQANQRSYLNRYFHIDLLTQYEEGEDVNVVHFSDLRDEHYNKQLLYLNKLLLLRKPVIIVTSLVYLHHPIMDPLFSMLNQYKRIKESGREIRWTSAIKSKLKKSY